MRLNSAVFEFFTRFPYAPQSVTFCCAVRKLAVQLYALTFQAEQMLQMVTLSSADLSSNILKH